jgi:hypothetical protein
VYRLRRGTPDRDASVFLNLLLLRWIKVPVSGVDATALDRRQPPQPLGEHDIGRPLEFRVALLEAGPVEPVRIPSLDLLERRPEHAHGSLASERVFAAQ